MEGGTLPIFCSAREADASGSSVAGGGKYKTFVFCVIPIDTRLFFKWILSV